MRLIVSLCLILCTALTQADGVTRSHAISMFDSEVPRYDADFSHFAYVNPNAPKGGALRLGAQEVSTASIPLFPRQRRQHGRCGNASGNERG